MINRELLSTDNQLNPPNEELLNVIRESDGRGAGTSEIVESVDLKTDAVRKRLMKMEDEGRVEKDAIGSDDDYSFVWYLAEGEREKPINPDIDKLVHHCELARDISRGCILGAKWMAMGGMAVILLTLTAIAEGMPLRPFPPDVLLYSGWAFVIVSVAILAGAGAVIYMAAIAELWGEWLVSRDSN